jgi:hypothetical protein
MRKSYPATFEKACHVLWAVRIMKLSQTQAALQAKLDGGTVNHIVHGRRFGEAFPKPLPRYSRTGRNPNGER